MHGAKCLAIFRHDTEPMRTKRRVQRFIDTCVDLLLQHFADFFVDAGRNGNVAFDPRGVQNDGEFNGWEEVGLEATMFVFVPGETGGLVLNKVVHEVAFFRP